MILNDQQIRIWKKAVMAYFKVLSQQLVGETEGNKDKPQSGYLVPWYLTQEHGVSVEVTHSVPISVGFIAGKRLETKCTYTGKGSTARDAH
jgi:hypothetical protein